VEPPGKDGKRTDEVEFWIESIPGSPIDLIVETGQIGVNGADITHVLGWLHNRDAAS